MVNRILPFLISISLLFLFFVILNPNQSALSSILEGYFDAEHYFRISKEGYSEEFLFAFFPLFPLTWKVLGSSGFIMSIINLLIFYGSTWWFFKAYSIKSFSEKLFYLTLPSIVFFSIPYTEAFFFFFSILTIIGLKEKKWFLMALGLFLMGLVRPAVTVIIPALILTKVVFNSKFTNSLFWVSLSSSLLGLMTTVLIQYFISQKWFIFYSAQSYWDNKLGIPSLPLSSWAGGLITKYDGVAFLVGIFSAFSIITITIKKLKSHTPKFLTIDTFFSLCYLAGMTFIVLIYREGLLFSLNRFLFSTAFLFVFLKSFPSLFSNISESFINLKRAPLIIGISTTFIWLVLFHSFVHIQTFLKYEIVSLILLVYYFFLIKPSNIKTMILVLLNTVFLAVLIERVINNLWIA